MDHFCTLIHKPEARNHTQAKAFQTWATREVLSANRTDGGYVKEEEKVAAGQMSENRFILQAMQMLRRKGDSLAKARDAAQTSSEWRMLERDCPYKALT